MTAYLAGFRPIHAGAAEAVEDVEAHAHDAELSTAPRSGFLDHLLTLLRKVEAPH